MKDTLHRGIQMCVCVCVFTCNSYIRLKGATKGEFLMVCVVMRWSSTNSRTSSSPTTTCTATSLQNIWYEWISWTVEQATQWGHTISFLFLFSLFIIIIIPLWGWKGYESLPLLTIIYSFLPDVHANLWVTLSINPKEFNLNLSSLDSERKP